MELGVDKRKVKDPTNKHGRDMWDTTREESVQSAGQSTPTNASNYDDSHFSHFINSGKNLCQVIKKSQNSPFLLKLPN